MIGVKAHPCRLGTTHSDSIVYQPKLYLQYKQSEMALGSYRKRIADFVERIKESFQLSQDSENMIGHRKKVLGWVNQQANRLSEQKEKLNTAGGLQALLNFAGLSTSRVKQMDLSQLNLIKFRDSLKNQIMYFEQSDLAEFSIPQDILQSFHFLNKRRCPQHIGIVYSPLMKPCFIKTKQSYDKCVTKVLVNQMRCTSLGSDPTHVIKYQRYTVQNLFNLLFNDESELTTVIKVEIQTKNSDKTIEIFCYLEDLANRPRQFVSLNELIIEQKTQNLYIEEGGNRCFIDETNLFYTCMTQLFIVPIQTVVSNFHLIKDQQHQQYFIRKIHCVEEKDKMPFFMRSHPSLRNPLTYFNNFLRYRQFRIDIFKGILNPSRLYANFYQILNILFIFLENDFSVRHNQSKSHSLCLNDSVFQIIWTIFQQIILLSNWLDEVINPIKQTVTMAEITNKLYPIFNEVVKQNNLSYSQYQRYMLDLPIENYLMINVSKLNIEKYKDRYISLDCIQPAIFNSPTQIYRNIFAKIVKNFDLRNTSIEQSIQFLNFIGNSYTELYEGTACVAMHPSWKWKKLWKQIVQFRNKQFQRLNYLTVALDLLALTFQFDSLEYADSPFREIKNEADQWRLLEITRRIHLLLREKYERKCQEYLSHLIQQSFKYKKYKVVRYLIEVGVHIKHYEEIFSHEQEASTLSSRFQRSNEKIKLIELMQVKEPEMFRRFQWEELINVRLKHEEKERDTTPLITIGKGRFYVQKKIYSHLTSTTVMSNTLSRKDYMFCNNRLIAKIKLQDVNTYIQLTEYPLLRYFYSYFMKELDKESLVLNFCGFFSDKGSLFHLIECIPQCFNFEKGLQYQNEADLKNLINQNDLSEAIIISMILMPTNIQLKNIIISPQLHNLFKNSKKGLFIVDFFDFYQKNGFELNSGDICLKIKNSLFLFDEMHNSISIKLLKKYSEMNVMQIINRVFKKCSELIRELNSTRPRNEQSQRQLYSLIFQNGYAVALAERMYKIKNAFENKLKSKLPIDHLQLLQILNPQLRYYYQQIMRSSNKLIERERNMLDDNFKHSFIVSDNLVSFFARSNRLSNEVDNFPQHYMKFNFQGPSQNLKLLHTNALKFNVFTDKITEYKNVSHEIIEYYIRNIDMSRYSQEEREELFDKLQEYSLEYLKNQKNCLPLSLIRITYVQGLKERKLKFSDERLRDLIFENCSCSQGEFNRLIKKYQNISNLELRGVTDLEKIGQLYINVANSLQIKNLKTLTITCCPNLETIDIKCDELQNLTIRNNTSLTHVYINSKRLKTMDCSQCNKLRLENIGIYIFMNVNVLLCKNSCDGDVKRLQDSCYSIYLTRILRYLCNRFEESNQYKLQLVITLNKLQLLDEKFYRFGNTRMNSNLGSLVSFITKAARQTLRITQRQIIEIFLHNKHIERLSVDELLKVQIESLTNIVDCLRYTKISKQFKQISFREIIKNPILFHDHLKLVEDMFECIKVEKVFSAKFTLFPQIQTQYYINLINLLNQKTNLEKLQLTFQNSFIDYEFFQSLFNLESEKNKIVKLEFIDCELQINENVQIEKQPLMKQLRICQGKIGSLTFVEKFINLTALQLISCTVSNNLISPFYVSIGKLYNLKALALVDLKSRIFENDLQLPLLFELFKNLEKLQQLDFSENRFTLDELTFFSRKIGTLSLKQLTLYDFYQPSICSYIDNFLAHETLRIIHIQFKIKQDTQILESFLCQLASNKTIIKLKIKTDRQIPSELCEVLQANKKLQQIHSNQPIPNWLKNHIAQNTQSNQSGMFESEPFEILSNSRHKKQDFYRIGLSLDGGGAKGLVIATELDYICRNVKQPLHKIFDCVGGTSIGGILALASTGTVDGKNPVCNTRDLMDIFQLYGNKIFKKSQIKQLTNLFDTKYDVTSFEDLLSSYFKDSKLSETLRETNVVITAVNRLTNEDMIFRSINAIFDRNKDFYLKDIARATSAAPTYFPSAQIKNVNATEKYSLIDGGVGLNNPSKLVIDDIIKIANNEAVKNNYFLLSLGTGRLKNEAIPESAGIVNLAPIIDSFTESANFFIEKDLSQNYKGHFLRLSPLINLNRKDADLDNTSPEILKVYRETGQAAAEQQFSHKIAYGKFKNQSFIEWLAENTARKYDL